MPARPPSPPSAPTGAPPPSAPPAGASPADAKARRLAEALRANLRRRKAAAAPTSDVGPVANEDHGDPQAAPRVGDGAPRG